MPARKDSESIIRDIMRKTRKKYNAEEKISIVLEGLRGEESIAAICRREGINPNLYYRWSKDFLEAGKKRLLRNLALARFDPAIFERPKSGFVLPIDTWAKRRLQPRMERLLVDSSLVSRIGLRPEIVRLLWQSFAAGRPGMYWSRIWAIYVLVSWCERHDLVRTEQVEAARDRRGVRLHDERGGRDRGRIDRLAEGDL